MTFKHIGLVIKCQSSFAFTYKADHKSKLNDLINYELQTFIKSKKEKHVCLCLFIYAKMTTTIYYINNKHGTLIFPYLILGNAWTQLWNSKKHLLLSASMCPFHIWFNWITYAYSHVIFVLFSPTASNITWTKEYVNSWMYLFS